MTAPSIREGVARALWALNENTDCPDYDLLSKPAKERALSWADAVPGTATVAARPARSVRRVLSMSANIAPSGSPFHMSHPRSLA